MENRVTTETNVDLTKKHKDKDTTDKYNFLFNGGSVNCGQFVEFEESDGCLYENSNYKYQYEEQKASEHKWSLKVVILIILTSDDLERDFESN